MSGLGAGVGGLAGGGAEGLGAGVGVLDGGGVGLGVGAAGFGAIGLGAEGVGFGAEGPCGGGVGFLGGPPGLPAKLALGNASSLRLRLKVMVLSPCFYHYKPPFKERSERLKE